MVEMIKIPDKIIKKSIEKWNIKFRTIDDAIDWWYTKGQIFCPICDYINDMWEKSKPTCNDCIIHDKGTSCCKEFVEVAECFDSGELSLNEVNKAIIIMRKKLESLL